MNYLPIAAGITGVMPIVRATGLLVSLATFQSSDAADFPDGFYSGNYQDVPGLVDLPCMSAPISVDSFNADESKALPQITSSAARHVLLDSIYPALVDGWREGWRVVIDGAVFDLIGVESDSQAQMTRIRITDVTI